ncbi:hypothetical protein LCGC14_1140130 [marine sediment metagenome]|uniref:GIY-YIG domain-containing protein n=1 Tax=marine sediment metagenome TaxID=412755 RepID=A0A0F9Q473_9ZZZZ
MYQLRKDLTYGGYIIDYMDLDTSGIYAIRNNINGKAYIGSSVNLHRRKNTHFNDLRSNRHYNCYLQRAWNKYGEENFIFEVLEYVSEENQLIEKEKTWIANSSNEIYNLMEVVEKDFRASIETRQKLSAAGKGRIVSEETRQKLSKVHKGRIIPKETRQKMSEVRKGITLSEETRKRMSLAQKRRFVRDGHGATSGRKLSEAHKDKIGRASRGRKHSNEAIEKMRKAKKGKYTGENSPWYGRKHSEETKKKIGEATRNRMYQNDLQLLLF